MSKYDKVLLKTAELFAQESFCERLKVGAVIAKDGRPLVTGYNGTIAGTDNCCEETIQIDCICDNYGCALCDGKGYTTRRTTSDFTVHAEQNAIYYAAKKGISVENCTIYVTHAPCPHCSKAIASSGIKRVVYGKEYKDTDGIQFLIRCGVEVTLID